MKQHETISRLLRLADRQGGVVTRRQALVAGATPRTLASMVRAGMLVRRHPGVYVVTGSERDHAVLCRAALAALGSLGGGAFASHRSAAWLLGLVDRPPPRVHVTASIPHSRRLAGVTVHRTTAATPAVMASGVRCSAARRTLVDLAADATAAEIGAALDRALAAGLVRVTDLRAVAAAGGRRGAARVRRSIDSRGIAGGPAPSVLESRMARLLTGAGLPRPAAELVAGPDGEYRLDYAYQDRFLAIELQGYTWHHTPEHLDRDLLRHRQLTLQGWTVVSSRGPTWSGDRPRWRTRWRLSTLRPVVVREPEDSASGCHEVSGGHERRIVRAHRRPSS